MKAQLQEIRGGGKFAIDRRSEFSKVNPQTARRTDVSAEELISGGYNGLLNTRAGAQLVPFPMID